MKAGNRQGSDLSIHITKPLKRDAEEEKRAEKHKTKKLKNRKRKREQDSQVPTKKGPSVGEEGPERTTSFRHLFSFAEAEISSPQRSKTTYEDNEGQSFALLGSGSILNDNQQEPESIPATDVGMIPEFSDNMTENALDTLAVSEEHHLGHEADYFGNDEMDYDSVAAEKDFNYQQSRLAPVAVQLDTSPEGILAMARNFCRKKTLEELEAEWCGQDGIKEQMRRDFKLKRRSALRDRRLGGASEKS